MKKAARTPGTRIAKKSITPIKRSLGFSTPDCSGMADTLSRIDFKGRQWNPTPMSTRRRRYRIAFVLFELLCRWIVPMNRTLLWLILAAVLVIGFLFYRPRPGRHLNVDPHAREEIEKAKRR
jgi:hypothetical protein